MHAVENPWNGMYIEIRKDTTRQRKGSLGIVHAVVSDGFEIQVVEVVLVTTRGMPFNELSTLRKKRISTHCIPVTRPGDPWPLTLGRPPFQKVQNPKV